MYIQTCIIYLPYISKSYNFYLNFQRKIVSYTVLLVGLSFTENFQNQNIRLGYLLNSSEFILAWEGTNSLKTIDSNKIVTEMSSTFTSKLCFINHLTAFGKLK